jgi:preprotein translocase subunit SecA
MFVDMITDLRSTVTQNFFRAQLSVQPPRPLPRPQRMILSGPSDTPETAVGSRAQPAVRSSASGPGVDDTGIAARARSDSPARGSGLGGALAGVPGGGAVPQDVRRLATNRGEAPEKQEPVSVEDEPGRNDPCPCGSGKKYKKCHGRAGDR